MKKLVLNAVGFPEAGDDVKRFQLLLENSFPLHKVASLSSKHRLRQLWNREDHIAAAELLALAYSIDQSMKISKTWTNNHIRKILGISKNEQIGSVFELNAAAMLSAAGNKIICGVKNSPGYDLELPFIDGTRLFLSLKNHDISDIEMAFQERCEKFYATASASLQFKGLPAYVRIEANEVMSEADWVAIEQLLPSLSFDANESINVVGKSTVRTMRLQPINDDVNFATTHFSSLFVVNSVAHSREQQNFSSNLEKAALNMKKHLSDVPNSIKVVFMRVHATASLAALEATAKILLESEEVNYGIDGVILYQPAIIRDKSTFSISHCLRVVASSRWPIEKRALSLKPFVGVQIQDSSRLVMQHNGQTIEQQTKDYFFQKGDYYHEWVLREGTFNMGNPAPGIRTHLVMQGQLFSGKIFPYEDKLLLI